MFEATDQLMPRSALQRGPRRPVAGHRVAFTVAGLILNAVVVALSASEPLGDVLLIALIGFLPASLFAFRGNETAFRRLADAIAVAYLALAVVFIYPIGFLPAALCLSIAAIAPAHRGVRRSRRPYVAAAAVLLVGLVALLIWQSAS